MNEISKIIDYLQFFTELEIQNRMDILEGSI